MEEMEGGRKNIGKEGQEIGLSSLFLDPTQQDD
jgi:hypothetical protein